MNQTTQILENISSLNSSSSSNYQIWSILAINILLLLERVFKNAKLVVKCGPKGCYFGNKTPPVSDSSNDSPVPRRKSADKPPEIKINNTEISQSSDYDNFLEFQKFQKSRNNSKQSTEEKP